MKRKAILLLGWGLLCRSLFAPAATLYVDLKSSAPTPPYLSWATAATRIQDAVDAAAAGDVILVTNGLYHSGVRNVSGTSNRVAVTLPMWVRSVNGPGVTAIVGQSGAAAVRCVYLASGAVLEGFTLTNGTTQSNFTFFQSMAGGVWCESAAAIVSNCVLIGNSAFNAAGGAYSGTLNNCTLTNNSAGIGGAAMNSVLNNCTLAGNSAGVGGGAYSASLNNCVVTRNLASEGGGANRSGLNNCVLTLNSASSAGGGAYQSTLNNCTLTGNTAFVGGGASGSMDIPSTLNNCIAFYNTAVIGDNYYVGGCWLSYSCSTPLPPGTGNLDAEPQLASGSHLSPSSPCLGSGNAAYSSGVDIDGEPWADPPSMGCDESWSGSVTGVLNVAMSVFYTNVTAAFPLGFQVAIDGRVSASSWNFGDGTVLSNRLFASHAWGATGDYVVILRAWNESYPTGVAASVTIHVVDPLVHYVSLASPSATPPYVSWATAASNIQDAVDAVTVAGATVLVSNGVYQSGARMVYGMSNRLAVVKPVFVRSFNGPLVTGIAGYTVPGTINGPTAIRCVYLANGALLSGFTLTNGATQSSGDPVTQQSGGGVLCEPTSGVVMNCVITGNSAYANGAGACFGTLNNCALIGNSAIGQYGYGGGSFAGKLNHCTLTGNSATVGNGAMYSTLTNCIVYYNAPPTRGNSYGCSFNYSCTTPLPSGGTGNFTNPPVFVDINFWSNLRLQVNSPCINAGTNSSASSLTDLDGRPRMVGSTVDLGAYEFQGAGMSEFIGWLQQYGLQTDGSADFLDSDGDHANNWQEWIAGTDPTSAASGLRMLSAAPAASAVTLTWSSVSNRSYALERATNFGTAQAFSVLQSNIVGLPDTTSWVDTGAPNLSPRFYRVRVE